MNEIREKQTRLIDDIIRLSVELQDKIYRFNATQAGFGSFYCWDNVVSNITRIASQLREKYEDEIR
jgi:hypothetical protein